MTAEKPAEAAKPAEKGETGASAPAALPNRKAWLVPWFVHYLRKYAAKSFHAVRLSRAGTQPEAVPADRPLIVAMNHPSWWDPVVGMLLSDLFPGRAAFAPIDAAALRNYGIFGWLGFFGIEPDTPRGALAFLRTATAVLRADTRSRPANALWVTVQGHFTDVRRRPTVIKAGVGHLAARVPGAVVLPLAVEYPFWNERFPEALARFGDPIDLSAAGAPTRTRTADEWTAAIAGGLEAAQDALAAEAQTRDPALFRAIVGGSAGVGGVYGLWRRLTSALTGRKFVAEHDAAVEEERGGKRRG
jgi:1-acyl-sn-glycerol-3-phosphate acyltransferase